MVGFGATQYLLEFDGWILHHRPTDVASVFVSQLACTNSKGTFRLENVKSLDLGKLLLAWINTAMSLLVSVLRCVIWDNCCRPCGHLSRTFFCSDNR